MVSLLPKQTNNCAESRKFSTYAGGRRYNLKKKAGAKFSLKVYNGLLWTIQEGCWETKVIFVTEKSNYKTLLHK
jgi:hypothetical protein